MNATSQIPQELMDSWARQSDALLNSYFSLFGQDLISRTHNSLQDVERLFFAPFAVISHGVESDPLLNFANKYALDLWGFDPFQLISTPSRLTAEPKAHEEREKILRETKLKGFLKNYEGIRISAAGKRFIISNVTIWNISDASGELLGQAATFSNWRNCLD